MRLAGGVDVGVQAVLRGDPLDDVGVGHLHEAAGARPPCQPVGHVQPGHGQLVTAAGALLDRDGGHLADGDRDQVALGPEGDLDLGPQGEQATLEQLEVGVVEAEHKGVRELHRLLDADQGEQLVQLGGQRPAVDGEHDRVEPALLSHGAPPGARG